MLRLLLVALLALPTVADDTILIPIFYNGPGGFGTQWRTTVLVRNRMATPLAVPGIDWLVTCPIPEGCARDVVDPGEHGTLIAPPSREGLVLHVDADDTERLAFRAFFAAAPRISGGSELPIVRSREFRTDDIYLHFVHLHGHPNPSRTSLRLYGIDARADTRVRIVLLDSFFGQIYAGRDVTLTVPAMPQDIPNIKPAFAELDLARAFPDVVDRAGQVDIRITPLPFADGTIPRIWALATITDNVTNEVRVVSPQ